MKVIPEAYRVHLFDSVHDEGYSRNKYTRYASGITFIVYTIK
jgi:hypothetical protein